MLELNRAADGRRTAALLVAGSGLAWLVLWLAERSSAGRYLSHHALDGARADARLVPLFIAGWVVMVVAMMLPTQLSAIVALQPALRSRPRRCGAALIAGYLAVWTLFGVVVYAGDWLLHQAMHAVPWLHHQAVFPGGLLLLLAGAYQLTPAKRVCLDACRPERACSAELRPADAALSRWWLLGVRHGLSCAGACWALMLLMFAVGAGELGWMLGLGALMAAEKNTAWGRRLVVPVGVVLLWAGVAALSIAVATSGHAVHLH